MSKRLIGINGFGRIGRISLRASLTSSILSKQVRVVQVNNPNMQLETMCHLLNFDSAHGRFSYKATPSTENNQQKILIHCRETNKVVSEVFVSNEMDPSQIPWNLSGAEVVADCTGVFLTRETASKHLAKNNPNSSVKKVILSAPAKDPSIPLIVMGVNSHLVADSSSGVGEEIFSNASCTTNCLAPLVKVVHDHFGIKTGLMTTVHAVTANQFLVDGFNKRSARTGFSGMHNIIPASTGAAKAVGKVIPELE